MAATAIFSAAICSHQYSPSTQHNFSIELGIGTRWRPSSSAAQSTKPPVILLRASSSSNSTVEKQDDESSSSSPSDILSDKSESSSSIPFGGCKTCGKADIERGCNGEGRIQGGIATVPGFGWWPIKAYRPCPALVATGGRYRRQGQSMDEVAGFGSVPKVSSKATAAATATTTTTTGESQPSKKKEGSRKFKR